MTASALSITVEAKTANVAQDAADAVARSYVNFVGSPGTAGGQVKAAAAVPQGSSHVVRDAGDGDDGVGKGC